LNRTLIAFGVLAGFLAPSGATAASISFSELFFTEPAFVAGSSTDALLTTTTGSSYQVSGEFCVEGACTNPVTPQSDAVLALANFMITCESGSGCFSPLDVAFQALGGSALNGQFALGLGLAGTGAADGSLTVCIQDSANVCASNLTGNDSLFIAFTSGGGPNGSGNTTINSSGSFNLFGDLHINALGAGASVNLSNGFVSLDQIQPVGDSGPPPEEFFEDTPDPATITLVPIGFAALALLKRRRGHAAPNSLVP